MSSDYNRATVDAGESRGRLGRAWDTLQDTITQPVETVTRSASLNTTSADVEDVDPPEDIDELVDLYYDLGFIRKNISEFVSDVTEPGIRVESDHEPTQDYFMGGDAAPQGAPTGGFLTEAFVFDEKRQHFNRGLDTTVTDRWRRGTVLVEYLYEDPDDPESIITGFTHVRPETVSVRTYQNSNELVAPDDTESADMITKRGEAAAYVQFDEQSILGRRTGRDLFTSDETSIPKSQNDILKQTLEQDIGGDDPEAGVFGESIIRSVRDPAEEYRDISRDEATAIKRIAWGVHTAQFNDHVIDLGDEKILVQWDDQDISDTETELENLGPGSVLTTDAKIDLERFAPDLPDLDDPMRRRIREIIDPLPAPFYKHSFADEINQFVTSDQQEDYQELIRDERHFQAAFWAAAFREVARRHPDLQAEGLTVSIEPDEEDSPVLSLDQSTIEQISTFADALDTLSGQLAPVDVFGEETIRELVAMLPEDVAAQDALAGDLDEGDDEVREQWAALVNGGGDE